MEVSTSLLDMDMKRSFCVGVWKVYPPVRIDGVDFEYLMALIYNAVGTSAYEKDIATLSSSLGEIDEREGAYTSPGVYTYDDDDNESSCEEGEISLRHVRRDTEGPSHVDEIHDADDDDDEEEEIDGIARPLAPFLMRPLSPDCLSPQTQFDRIMGPRLNALEPRPPSQECHHRNRVLAELSLRRARVAHDRSKPQHAGMPLHQHAILSDESDDEDVESALATNDAYNDDDDGDGENQEEDEIPHVGYPLVTLDLPQNLFHHLVAMGFEAALTLSALQTYFKDLTDANNEAPSNDVGIFVALVKAVTRAHVAENGDPYMAKPPGSMKKLKSIIKPIQQDTTFPWPVFDMAQYEFGTARPGTSFACVVVLVNLPRVAAGVDFDALHDVLLAHLFYMLSNPIQVILPLAPNAYTMKGHGFVEFQNRHQAMLAARTLDGLQWSRTEPPIRAMLFREYHGSHSKEIGGADADTESLTLHALDLISEDDEVDDDDDSTYHLSQRNEQLEYLIHYIEQDRDAVLIENEELKCAMEKYRAREQQQEEALHSLSNLRKRIQVNEQKYREHMKRMQQNERVIETLRRRLQELTGHTQSLHMLSIAELRDLEDTLDTALYKARAIKEQKIVEQRQALDRQVEVHQELKLCVVCMATEKTILCLPCRHVCMCEACANHEQMQRCPICRLEIEEKMLIYA
ncbi:Aste57867_12514 [Aphanomyces stellatus]|uniref:Aste57867_12514 protein n=1 Tax=Aphanomyces stellatus TaxID=120398 RepID=A0A485KWE6_9STRA|nr:hypothetical protein As57867_012468 [Aphanomyces stellatus]VFT89365.1 Aste57867_12514 [Aphanomyces stellatus]